MGWGREKILKIVKRKKPQQFVPHAAHTTFPSPTTN